MRKLLCVLILILAVLLVLGGCSKEEPTKKVVAKPVTKTAAGTPETSAPAKEPIGEEEETVIEQANEAASTPQAGIAYCEQLSSEDVAGIIGGSWAKTTDCPKHPMMPHGVTVCMCSYDGPKQIYVNVETQLYDEASDALRVYNMYCKGAVEQNEVGDKSCRFNRTSTLTPNFVYFMKGSYFVKVSCLGGSCPLNSVAQLAQGVAAKI